jgi:hypothetical protein
MALFTAIATGLGALGLTGVTAAGVAATAAVGATAYGVQQSPRYRDKQQKLKLECKEKKPLELDAVL